jgi:hypothetical protein
MDLTGLDGEIHTLEDLNTLGGSMEIIDDEKFWHVIENREIRTRISPVQPGVVRYIRSPASIGPAMVLPAGGSGQEYSSS